MDIGTIPLRGSRRLGWIITAGVMAVILLLITLGLRAQPPLENGLAPGFTLALFDGRKVSLDDLRGRVVVLNFWASWCPPCRDEAPALESAWQEYRGQGVAFVGVAMKDVPSKAAGFARSAGMTYDIGSDTDGRITGAYRVTAVPETFVIARDGRIVAHFIGPVTQAALGTTLDGLLQ